jgi:hypothetical protein
MTVFDTTPVWKDALNGWEGIHDSPARENRAHRSGIRVMENAFLERFVTTAHWILPVLWSANNGDVQITGTHLIWENKYVPIIPCRAFCSPEGR